METITDATLEISDTHPDVIPVINVSMETNQNSQVLDDTINSAKKNATVQGTSTGHEGVKPEEIFQLRGHYVTSALSGMYVQGVQYFDFKNVNFINNTGIANLIDILKDLLKEGIEVKFVNVKENIKNKFISMGLDSVFHFS
ncbi:MAG: STAS domain-containing protein [Bacteroidia bacterium]